VVGLSEAVQLVGIFWRTSAILNLRRIEHRNLVSILHFLLSHGFAMRKKKAKPNVLINEDQVRQEQEAQRDMAKHMIKTARQMREEALEMRLSTMKKRLP
jgi:hypothetical protein